VAPPYNGNKNCLAILKGQSLLPPEKVRGNEVKEDMKKNALDV